jgi:uncharacterized protein YbbC (DUF1343 family)
MNRVEVGFAVALRFAGLFGKRAVMGLLATIVGVLAIGCAASESGTAQVRPGIEVLLTDSAHLIAHRRVGLLTNQTGVDSRGNGDVEVLVDAGVNLTAIFSPEHGFRGQLDEENIGHSTDSATGIPIFSLYGERRAPTPEMFDLIDVMLADLQDIGARTYTYISAILHVMEASVDSDVPVVILDRPNPIDGEHVHGPVLDIAFSTYVGMLPVPLRHGMTMGELALFGNSELAINAAVTVVPAAGWDRSMWFDETDLPWIKPSPNMPDLESATHYPGMVLFEGTNVSVGRGTPIAFQVLGAPWFQTAELLSRLENEPGVIVSDTTFTPVEPADRKYGGQLLPALRFLVTDRQSYDPTRLAARVFSAVRDVHGNALQLRAGIDRLAGSSALRSWLEGSGDPESLVASWEPALEAFSRTRAPYLIY